MGWTTVIGSTKKQVINQLIERQENEAGVWETKAHTLRGNILWSVIERTYKLENNRVDRFILCAIIGYDKFAGGWGYKTMSENMGPCYYSCPLSYLEMTPPDDHYGWRDKVRAYHVNAGRKFTLGETINLKGCKIPFVQIVSVKPLRGQYAGIVYRVPRRLIAA